MKGWLIALGVLLLGLALAILGRDGRALRKTEHDAAALLGSKIKKEQLKAEHLNKKAEKQKAGAKLAAEATVARLEKISGKDNSMDDLLSAWKSERVRQSEPG
jgi:hypothetical protein